MDNKNNSGDGNSGNCNSGNSNLGDRNSGDCNSGSCNSGSWNSGDWNSGDGNLGNCNSGNSNSGDGNLGNWNSGNSNLGDRNSGDGNLGNWNSGHSNSGYCNSITPETVLIFNKEALRTDWEEADKPDWMYVDLTRWIYESEMTDKEKESHPSYTTTGGYLKVYSSLKEAYVEAWEKASEEDKRKTFKLPNYNEEVFKEVFGFTPHITRKVKVVCEGKEVWLSEESARALNLI